ncbi:hypothetical protein [Streptomyces sp. SID11385]|uniref:hypothetical protein n=1 Tax=Streptomyces sp. SID11385 TaxID=2706031 RepID=UPI0013C6B5AE|nr:hypothetical protein [Streptomyces sp. SID11385]NEA40918.1 hypothetical protein [Streptomyces sp. SID11385]
MTGPEHYREAERLLADARHEGPDGVAYIRPENIAAAQVHATLAQAAATAMQAAVEGSEPGMSSQEFTAWYDAAGVKPQKDGAL